MKHRLDVERVRGHGWWGWCSCGDWTVMREESAGDVRALHADHVAAPDDRTLSDLLWEGELS